MKFYQEIKEEDLPPPNENIEYVFAWWHVPILIVLWFVGVLFRDFVYKNMRKW